jgi:hypothetical protein
MATKKKTDKATSTKTAKAKATTKTTKGTKAAKAPKPPKAPKAEPVGPVKARHPKARVIDAHGGKEALAKSLASAIVREDQDAGELAGRLKVASNQQLLRLQQTVDTVKQKWGNRAKLIAAIGTAQNKSKDKDYLAKLETFSLPQLVDLAQTSERRARA